MLFDATEMDRPKEPVGSDIEYSCMDPGELGRLLKKTVAMMVSAVVPTGVESVFTKGYAPCMVKVPPGALRLTPPVPPVNTQAPPLAVTPEFNAAIQESSALPTSVRLPAVKRCAVMLGHAAVDGTTPGG